MWTFFPHKKSLPLDNKCPRENKWFQGKQNHTYFTCFPWNIFSDKIASMNFCCEKLKSKMWKWTVSQFRTKTTAKSEQIEWFQWEKEFRDRKLPMPWPKNIKFPRTMSSLAPTSLVRTKYLGNLICFSSMTYIVILSLNYFSIILLRYVKIA